MARPDTQSRLAVELIRKRIELGDHAAGALPGERQLATELGLSRPTVRKAIQQLADEGLLSRGPTGRLLAGAPTPTEGRRRLIAFLHPGRIGSENALWRDGVYDAAEAQDAVVRTLSYAHYGDPVVSTALEGFDGVFLLPLAEETIPDPLLKRLLNADVRVVVLDQDESAQGLRSVIVFPFEAGEKLLNHLHALGHRRIDCISIHPTNPVIEARLNGWRRFLARKELTGELIGKPGTGDPLQAAYRAMAAHLKRSERPATAVFGTTAHAAIGAMRALHERGLHIGRDVSICAINDEGFGPYLVPSLTSLQTPPRERYLRKAVEWMLGEAEWPRPTLVQPRSVPFFAGESTGPARE